VVHDYIGSGRSIRRGGRGICLLSMGQDLPDVRNLKEKNFAETSTIYDREGNVLYKIYGEENRQYVPLDQINKM
jgi:membrane carboxypeptidase/penicillin-binding protein